MGAALLRRLPELGQQHRFAITCGGRDDVDPLLQQAFQCAAVSRYGHGVQRQGRRQ
jgi:hypothetical protein